MLTRNANISSRVASLLLAVLTVVAIDNSALAAPNPEGRWLLTLTIPDGPGSRNTRTIVLVADIRSRGTSLNGKLTLTDADNRTFPGVWRQIGKRLSIAFEFPCPGPSGSPCASLILISKMKPATHLKKGRVILMWDTPNDRDPSFYDSTAASFVGDRIE
jgi:hypothetical protein